MEIIPVLLNIRSAHNVGSIMRSAAGLGCKSIITVGITPHLPTEDDKRLPHVAARAEAQIKKTALGAEEILAYKHFSEFDDVISELKTAGYSLVAVEQAKNSTQLDSLKVKSPLALIFGSEIDGIKPEDLAKCDFIAEIPMPGQKKSLNVASSAAIAIYKLSENIY